MTETIATELREHNTPKRARRVLMLVAGGVLLVGACGSSATKASTNPASNTPASNTPASSTTGAQAVAKTGMTKLGNVLVDSRGMTLYTLTNAGKAVPCTGACATAWPPLTATTAHVAGGQGVNGLATTTTANGTQVTHNGLPLYRFSHDAAAGDANGDGLTSFGGTWHAVSVSGTAPASNAPAPTPTTSSSSGGGYGY